MFCFLLIAASIGLPSHSEVVAGELPDVNEVTDFGLGINLPNPNIIETIGWRGESLVIQPVEIATGYHIGYRLSVEAGSDGAGGVAMTSARGYKINATRDGRNLLPDSWGLRLANTQNIWHGLTYGQSSEIAREIGDYPTSRSIYVEFGVNNQNLWADTYQVKLRYSITPEVSSSPAIIESDSRYAMSVGGRVKLIGVNLEAGKFGVDLNNNGKLDSGEFCRDYSEVIDSNHLNCAPPENSTIRDLGHAVYSIRMKWTDDGGVVHDEDSGKTVVYYYQPTIEDLSYAAQQKVANLHLRVWDKIDLRDMVQGGDIYWLLNSDGTVFQMGKELTWDQLPGQTSDAVSNVVEDASNFSDINNKIVAFGGGEVDGQPSFLAISRDGQTIYGMGANSNNRLLTVGDYLNKVAKVNNHAIQVGGRIRQITMGNNFYILLNKGAGRSTGETGLYGWGVNGHCQLGNDHCGKARWPSDAPVELPHADKLDEDDYVTKIAAGGSHAIALTNKGQVLTWGYKGTSGSLVGDGRLGWETKSDAAHLHSVTKDTKNKNYLPQFSTGFRATDIAATDDFSAIIGSDNSNSGLYLFGGMFGYKTNTTPTFNGEFTALSASGRVLLAMNKEGRVSQINTGRGVPIVTIWPSGAQRIFAGANYSYFATADQRVKRVRLSSAVSSSSPEIGDITDYLKYPEYNIRLRGYHLGSDTFAWLDYNDNGRKDDGEEIEVTVGQNNDSRNVLLVRIETRQDKIGTFKLCVVNQYSDANCAAKVNISRESGEPVTLLGESASSASASFTSVGAKSKVAAPSDIEVGKAKTNSPADDPITTASKATKPDGKLTTSNNADENLGADTSIASDKIDKALRDENNQQCLTLLSQNDASKGASATTTMAPQAVDCVTQLVAAGIIEKRIINDGDGFINGTSCVDVDCQAQLTIFCNDGQCFSLVFTKAALDAFARQVVSSPAVSGGADIIPTAPHFAERNIKDNDGGEIVTTGV